MSGVVGNEIDHLFASHHKLIRAAFELAVAEKTRQVVGVTISNCGTTTDYLVLFVPQLRDGIVDRIQLIATPHVSVGDCKTAAPQLSLESVIAHELTNSLATIANLSSAAKRQLRESEKLFPLLSLLESQAVDSARTAICSSRPAI